MLVKFTLTMKQKKGGTATPFATTVVVTKPDQEIKTSGQRERPKRKRWHGLL